MSKGYKDLASGIFFIFLAAFLYIQSYAITASTADALGPQFFPRLVAICMVLLAVMQIYKSINLVREEKKAEAPPKEKNGFNYPLYITILLLIAYVALVPKLGYMLTTIVYLFCQIFMLFPTGAFKHKKILAISLAVSIFIPIGVYYLFLKAFMIFLPAGILG